MQQSAAPSSMMATSIQAGAASSPGPRPANEDNLFVHSGGADAGRSMLYVVADGVGGQSAGALASQLAVTTISEVFYDLRQRGYDMAAALQSAVDQANTVIYESSLAQGVDRMGSTVVAAGWDDRQLTVAHVGDARAYLLQDGRLRQVTRDHTWVQEQVDLGTIQPDDAARHDLRHVVTRVLGNHPTVEVTITGPLATGQTAILMLCSDGLHDVVSESDMQKILSGKGAQAAADQLVAEALRRETADNTTVVVVRRGLATNAGVAPLPSGMDASGMGAVEAQPRSRRTLFIWLGIVALALLLLGAAVLTSTLSPGPAVEGQPSPLPTVAIAPVLVPATSPALSVATSTVAATVLSGTAAVELPEYCVRPAYIAYFRSDEQAADNNLNDDAIAIVTRMRLLDPQLVSMPAQGSAVNLNFAHVQPLDPSGLPAGWVLIEAIEICNS